VAKSVSLGLDDQLCFALYAATHRIQALYRPLLEDLGLTYPQYIVLLVLWEGDDLTVSQLGDRLQLTSATLTPLLKRMEGAGLVYRHRSTVDERKVTVSLTAAGTALKSEVSPITEAVTCAASESAEDLEDLVARLTELRRQLPGSVQQHS